MKPSRPPVCTIPNQIIYYDQRILRPGSTKHSSDNRQIQRCLSSHQEQHSGQRISYVYYPTQTRTSSPPNTTQFQSNEQIGNVIQFQNIPSETINNQHNRFISLDLNTQNKQHKQEIQEKDQIITDQQSQIGELQNQLSQKVHDYQILKEKFEQEFKKFNDDIQLSLKSIDLNIQLNDFTSQFMQEIDKKVQNLQNNLNNQIDELNKQLQIQQEQTDKICKNLMANTNLRLNQDEQHFQQELQIISQKIKESLDRKKAEQLISCQINTLQQQYQTQLQQAHQIINKINSDKSYELNSIKVEIQNAINQLNQQVNSQLQIIINYMNDGQQTQNFNKQESQSTKLQIQSLINQFNNLQEQFAFKTKEYKNNINILEDKNNVLNKEIQQQQLIIQKQQQEIYKISSLQQSNKISRNPSIKQQISPKNCKSNSFYTNSTGINISKNRPQSLNKKVKTLLNHYSEISIEDFVDFNENSILDSIENESIDLSKNDFRTSRLNSPKQIQNSFKLSKQISINKLMSEEFNKQQSKLQSNSSKENMKIINSPIEQAIKRRLLYLGKQNKTLLCTYQGQQIYDADMGMQLLDDSGKPFIISEEQKNELIEKQLISLI